MKKQAVRNEMFTTICDMMSGDRNEKDRMFGM